MLNAVIWVAATVAMFAIGGGLVPVLAAVILALVVANVRNRARKAELERLIGEYVRSYGSTPTGLSTRATGAGWALGSVLGGSTIGGLLGAAVDITRHLVGQSGMSDEQKALHNRIAGLGAWSPFHGVFILTLWLAMSWGVLALLQL